MELWNDGPGEMYKWKVTSVTDGAEYERIQLVKHVASGKIHLLHHFFLALMKLQM